ncbi:hypothetical protein [Medusavirus stheno T3]|uniref:Uncharacterized protein n=1 Tax=Medusavirus stheno T3 TaxID=3069717 RepID=A0A7S7YFL1_9VIRU|nr:hypothetical protein QKU73_gp006 [Acanthamoeba castellanii medusavirus]QPB44187.1 hypothetical protein [Medusavirus stheno T3]
MDLKSQRVADLRQLARRIRISGYDRLRKHELVSLLADLLNDQYDDDDYLYNLNEELQIRREKETPEVIAPVPLVIERDDRVVRMMDKALRTLFDRHTAATVTLSAGFATLNAAIAAVARAFGIFVRGTPRSTDGERLALLEAILTREKMIPVLVKLDELTATFHGHVDATIVGNHRHALLSWRGDVFVLLKIGSHWYAVVKRAGGAAKFQVDDLRQSIVYEQFCHTLAPDLKRRHDQYIEVARINGAVQKKWPGVVRAHLTPSVRRLLEDTIAQGDTAEINAALMSGTAAQRELNAFFASPAVGTLYRERIVVYSVFTGSTVARRQLIEHLVDQWHAGTSRELRGVLPVTFNADNSCHQAFGTGIHGKVLILVIELCPGTRVFVPDGNFMFPALKIERRSHDTLLLPPNPTFHLQADPERYVMHRRAATWWNPKKMRETEIYVFRVSTCPE